MGKKDAKFIMMDVLISHIGFIHDVYASIILSL